MRYDLPTGNSPSHFANSSGLGPVSLYYHNISKNSSPARSVERRDFGPEILVLRYRGVCHHARPVVFQQTRVPNGLSMGAN